MPNQFITPAQFGKEMREFMNVHTGYRSTQKALEGSGIHIKPVPQGSAAQEIGRAAGQADPGGQAAGGKELFQPG